MCRSFYFIRVIIRSHSPLAPGSPKLGATFQTKSRILEQLDVPLLSKSISLFSLGNNYYFRSLDIMSYRKTFFGCIGSLNYHSRKRDIVFFFICITLRYKITKVRNRIQKLFYNTIPTLSNLKT